jgi:prephenate dehydrogenase
VTGTDLDQARARRALELGALDAVGEDPDADVVVVATPAGPARGEIQRALTTSPSAVITDVAGVKAPIVEAIEDPRFIGGHPMAGSEQEGIEGADPTLFEGATWVLTPTPATEAGAYARLRSLVRSLGANPVAMPAERHDELVALVSHVPHLTAATLMNLAADAAEEHVTLLRLAAGGFRDMTRIAAGHPGIWPDVCEANRDGIVETLDLLVAELKKVRDLVAATDRPGLVAMLERAREARQNLPSRVPLAEAAAELRVPVADRPGAIAEVTTLLGELGINIFDLEIAHSAEGERGVMVLVVDAAEADRARTALASRGYRCGPPRVPRP